MSDLHKISAEKALERELRCSFCDKEPNEGSDLIVGPGVSICGECIAASSDILSAEDRDGGEESFEPGEDDPEGGQPGQDDPSANHRSQNVSVTRPKRFRLLTDADVNGLVSLDELIDLMPDVLRRFSSGGAVQPVRTVMPVGRDRERFSVMPACFRDSSALGAKLETVFEQNSARDLPTRLATILLFDPETGALWAVIDGSFITEIRTAAVSAVSADLLARESASELAIVGCGVQARSHLDAMESLFELSQVRVWSRTPEHQAAFLEVMGTSTQAKLVGTDSAEQAVRGADLVVLATSASEPVIRNDWIKEGAHVISIGAGRPDEREMDPALVARGRLFVESREVALVESGDIALGIKEHRFNASHVAGELGELVANKVEGRRSPREITIFKSLGLAVEDIAAADLVYRRAMARDIGQELEI
ncbi:MAG TPA: ClpX C4-type zinc finger protein [Vicinamibacterales bacterium]|jgi:alanine dehydrogenase|nr:ClpX C4-type zinc finger protein [Vicinamibacterales bacterium]